MGKPGLLTKIVLATAFSLILVGLLGFLFSDTRHGIASASDDRAQASFISETAASEKQVEDLAQASPAWRQKLTKHIFANIEKELQSLEQQLIRHNSTKGKRLIKRVGVALQKMRSGKQNFIRTGQESSLDTFYNGRTVLEYNLWKLKNLTRNLKMDTVQSHGLYRVYALTNKWLVYVAHREINARRQGTLDTSYQAETEPAGEQNSEDANADFQQISEVAKITAQDIEKASQALSKQPAVLRTTEPGVKPSTLKTRPLNAETIQKPDPNLRTKEEATPPKTFEDDNKLFSQSSAEKQPAEPATPEALELETPQQPELMPGKNSDAPTIFEEGVDFPEASSNSNWMFLLGMAGMILVAFLIFRSKRKTAKYLEHDDQHTNDLVEIHTLIESHPTGDTQFDSVSEVSENRDYSLENSIFRETPSNDPDHMTLQKEPSSMEIEIPETMSSSVEGGSTVSEMEESVTDNKFADEAQEDATFQVEEISQRLESILKEKEDLEKQMETLRNERKKYAQEWESLLSENNSLMKQLKNSNEVKEELEEQLEDLNAEKKDLNRGLENTLMENDSLTEKIETFNEAKEGFEEQLEILRSREEQLVNDLESTLAEKDSLTEKLESALAKNSFLTENLESSQTEQTVFAHELETLRAEKEANTQELETFRAEREEFAHGLENILAENDSLTETLETLHEEKESLKQQLETLRAEKGETDQEKENILAENNSLIEKFETSNEAKENLEKQLKSLHAELEVFAQNQENTLAANNSLTEKLEASRREKESLETQLAALHSREEDLAQNLENTLAGNNSLSDNLETSRTGEEDRDKQLDTLRAEKEEIARKLGNTLAENDSLTETLEISHKEKELLEQEKNNAAAKLEALAKTLKSTREKNELLTQEQKSIHAKIKTLTEQFKITQEENEIITKQNKTLMNQLEAIQTENDQSIKSKHNLTEEIEALSVDAKDLKEKLESTSSENKRLDPEKSENTNTIDLIFDHDTPELTDAQAGESAMDDETTEDIPFSILNSVGEAEIDNETSAPEKSEITNTIDLIFDHDTPELTDAQAGESAMDDELTEDMPFLILNSARNAEMVEGDAIEENQNILPEPLPSDQETNHPDVILLQTILKVAKGFRNINKRLYKIAETRLAPSIKDSPGNSIAEDKTLE